MCNVMSATAPALPGLRPTRSAEGIGYGSKFKANTLAAFALIARPGALRRRTAHPVLPDRISVEPLRSSRRRTIGCNFAQAGRDRHPQARVRSSTARRRFGDEHGVQQTGKAAGYMHAGYRRDIGLHYSLACPATPRPGPGARPARLPVRLRRKHDQSAAGPRRRPRFLRYRDRRPGSPHQVDAPASGFAPAFPTFRMPSAPSMFHHGKERWHGVAFVVGSKVGRVRGPKYRAPDDNHCGFDGKP